MSAGMEKIELCSRDVCTGCGSCASVCPRRCIILQATGEGFHFPIIDADSCINCSLFIKSCHQLNSKVKKQLPIDVYAAWNLDKVVRATSSSGGVFSALAEVVLKQKGVVFGASFTDGLKLQHIDIESNIDVHKLRGSKYLQSDTADSYTKTRHFLEEGRFVLFSGTPCQIAGLYSFLKKKYDTLVTCDFVCHGVPSQEAFNLYKRRLSISENDTGIFSFRDTEGWGYRLAYRGKAISTVDNYYFRAFSKGLMFMPACYDCRYAIPERVSDFTMGDFWGIGAKVPFHHSMDTGVSLLLVNSTKGAEILKECTHSLFLEQRTLEEAIEGNYNLNHKSIKPRGRETFYDDFRRMNKWALMKKYALFPSLRDFLRPIKRYYKIYMSKS